MTLRVARGRFDDERCIVAGEPWHVELEARVAVLARLGLDGKRFRGARDARNYFRAVYGRPTIFEPRDEIERCVFSGEPRSRI